MLQKYLTTFTRVLLRPKVYSIINVFGLAIGIASMLLISLYAIDKLSYHGFYKDTDRIYSAGVKEPLYLLKNKCHRAFQLIRWTQYRMHCNFGYTISHSTTIRTRSPFAPLGKFEE